MPLTEKRSFLKNDVFFSKIVFVKIVKCVMRDIIVINDRKYLPK